MDHYASSFFGKFFQLFRSIFKYILCVWIFKLLFYYFSSLVSKAKKPEKKGFF